MSGAGLPVHPYFGALPELDMFMPIAMVDLADGRPIELTVYMNEARLTDFTPSDLDGFVALAQGLPELDAKLRAAIPAEIRLRWLSDRLEPFGEDWRDLMAAAFPGAQRAEDVSPAAFARALWLERGCFSLSPEDSGGAALSLDYRILPPDHDSEVVVARFSLEGALLDVVIES